MLAQRIAELLAQSEALGEAGDVDAAQAVVAQADTLKVPPHTEPPPPLPMALVAGADTLMLPPRTERTKRDPCVGPARAL